METLVTLVNNNTPTSDPPIARPLALAKEGSIRFENAHFGYHPDRPIFKELSFEIPAGKRVFVVGPSGCGKSTIFRLLFRFYHPSSGHITIYGQDISAVTPQSLRKSIGAVPQDTSLSHSIVLHNIRYGRLSATNEEVVEVAKKANVHGSTMELQRGMRFRLERVSGGEKQRLAVTRVLLKDPEFMFFDEATSALDAHTESELLKSIHSMLLSPSHGKPRANVFTAHRLHIVIEADLIIALKDGQLVEQGTHEELLALDGLYKSMWVQQSSYGSEVGVGSSSASEEDETGSEGKGEEGKVNVKELEVVSEKVKA
ncbi:Iron-sulfur clusters transporter ATM1, mitochondrial [Leucoagaricus sp. SymC.cos]|nr:Iron-sulfur clusters transporter ATM1, mitochondrial [Leucoagaricus sp. SymC.cos]